MKIKYEKPELILISVNAAKNYALTVSGGNLDMNYDIGFNDFWNN